MMDSIAIGTVGIHTTQAFNKLNKLFKEEFGKELRMNQMGIPYLYIMVEDRFEISETQKAAMVYFIKGYTAVNDKIKVHLNNSNIAS